MRLPGNPVWLRISPFLAKELKEEADREEIANARTALSRPIRRSSPDLRFNGNFSPIVVRTAGEEKRTESVEQQQSRINANLRAESMKGVASPRRVEKREKESMSQAGPSGDHGDAPVAGNMEGITPTRQTWMPPPNNE